MMNFPKIDSLFETYDLYYGYIHHYLNTMPCNFYTFNTFSLPTSLLSLIFVSFMIMAFKRIRRYHRYKKEFNEIISIMYQTKRGGHHNLQMGKVNEVYTDYIKEFLMIYALFVLRNVKVEEMHTYLTNNIDSLADAQAFIEEFKTRFSSKQLICPPTHSTHSTHSTHPKSPVHPNSPIHPINPIHPTNVRRSQRLNRF